MVPVLEGGNPILKDSEQPNHPKQALSEAGSLVGGFHHWVSPGEGGSWIY